MDLQDLKIAAAREALREVRDGMRLGLGTGSTAAEFVRMLGEARFAGLRCTCTSEKTEQQARALGIATFSLAEVAPLDLAVDGTDAIDEVLRLIKGGGGALLREKVVAAISKREAIVVGGDKIVKRLGTTFPLPVEAVPFAVGPVKRALVRLGCAPRLRERGGKPYVTDNGNHILDCTFKQGIADAPALERAIAMIPGAVASGLFIGLAHLLVIGSDDGSCDMREKHR